MTTGNGATRPGTGNAAPANGEANDDIALWQARVSAVVRPERFAHILRVAELAKRIAKVNGLDEGRAYLAGIVHDVARDLPYAELHRLAPPENDIDARHALAVHGRAGRVLLERWGLTDPVVLEAVEDHTTGPRGGNDVAVALYVADVSEPGRGVNDDIRELALKDLHAAYLQAMTAKVRYLQGRGIQVHPRTLAAYETLQREGAAGASRERLEAPLGATGGPS
ncbi:MAG TPA: bis(5'-nucleosyl)-tetraphosphatase (symmetrical) YqeK [Deinococcales bacterium]|nr:bis(5'-nucleosyl)-tetraphosphatase (symmetrical) YqeK [Deinococcales bacterium]